METALNSWLEQVEDQINQILEKISDKASLYDLQSLDFRLQNEIKERQESDD